MNAQALYRLPFADQYVQVEQLTGADSSQPMQFTEVEQLEGQRGFVMIPFEVTAEHPVLLIRPDRVSTRAVSTLPELRAEEELHVAASEDNASAPDADYVRAFDAFIGAIRGGAFGKLVLSRSTLRPWAHGRNEVPTWPQMLSLFRRACLAYPRLMVYLVTTPSGYWLGCTPEILLSGSRSHYRTVALAGTQTADSVGDVRQAVWDDKNRQEQAIVADYIRQRLQQVAEVIEEEGPYTSRAGQLLHLKTEFHFAPRAPFSICSMVRRLHPTPAVCGLPKEEAHRFILEHEGYDRSYYSGVVGMLDPEEETQLYVNLRSARLDGQGACLYVGGGLLADSALDKEWVETENKMRTMGEVM